MLGLGAFLFHRPRGSLDRLVHLAEVFDEEFVEVRLLCMDRDKCLGTDLCDRLSQFRGHHVSRAMNLVHWQSEMVEPVDKRSEERRVGKEWRVPRGRGRGIKKR